MFAWMWSCMVIAFKSVVGGFLWGTAFCVAGLIIGLIIVGIAKILER